MHETELIEDRITLITVVYKYKIKMILMVWICGMENPATSSTWFLIIDISVDLNFHNWFLSSIYIISLVRSANLFFFFYTMFFYFRMLWSSTFLITVSYLYLFLIYIVYRLTYIVVCCTSFFDLSLNSMLLHCSQRQHLS